VLEDAGFEPRTEPRKWIQRFRKYDVRANFGIKIPDPGVKKALDHGSGIPDLNPEHLSF
jgi:hypothetical protein